MTFSHTIFIFFIVLMMLTVIIKLNIQSNKKNKKLLNEKIKFIESYQLPSEVVKKWKSHYPSMTLEQESLGQKALKQFFLIYLNKTIYHKASHYSLDMPSKVVDALWHEFILMSKAYSIFCVQAFGSYLHHTPHGTPLVTDLRKSPLGKGLINTYQGTSELPVKLMMVGSLPLLFAMDSMMNISGGFLYDAAHLESQLRLANHSDSSGDSLDSDSSGSDSSCSSGCGD